MQIWSLLTVDAQRRHQSFSRSFVERVQAMSRARALLKNKSASPGALSAIRFLIPSDAPHKGAAKGIRAPQCGDDES